MMFKNSVEKNLEFAEKYDLKYLLASGLDYIYEKLDIWIEKSMYGKKYFGIDRSTFMINGDGKILNQWNKVKVKSHVKEVFELAKKVPLIYFA